MADYPTPYPIDQGHLTGPNTLSTGKMVKGKVTRGRAVVMSFALKHPAAGLGRTTARNLGVGARTRAYGRGPNKGISK